MKLKNLWTEDFNKSILINNIVGLSLKFYKLALYCVRLKAGLSVLEDRRSVQESDLKLYTKFLELKLIL